MTPSRVWIVVVLASVSALALTVAVGCTAIVGSPGEIELSASEFDFGTIPNTGPVSRTFQVRNVGRGELEISGVSTSCGCTTAEVSTRRLPPGAVSDLTVTYDPQVHDGETGQFMRVVYVRSDDPDTPEASLTVRVTVVESGKSGEVSLTSGSSLYQVFMCPCCGQDIGSCTCGMAEERRAFVDQHVIHGASQDQVYRAMFQAYGAGAFFDQALAAQVQADLLAELPADRPVLVVEPPEMNLGAVPIAGGLISATFTARNAGQSDLIITGLQTSCGCTTAVLETSQGTSPVFGANLAEHPTDWSAVLAPGEEASLVATFDPMTHGSEATGQFRRVVSILSSDPLNSRLDVSLDVEVTP